MAAAPEPLVLLALVALVGYVRRDPVLVLVARIKQNQA
jgi:hypothetical protein